MIDMSHLITMVGSGAVVKFLDSLAAKHKAKEAAHKKEAAEITLARDAMHRIQRLEDKVDISQRNHEDCERRYTALDQNYRSLFSEHAKLRHENDLVKEDVKHLKKRFLEERRRNTETIDEDETPTIETALIRRPAVWPPPLNKFKK